MFIQAKETKYNGIIYRSRLEARWAVYFDLLEVPHMYELEGFKLSTGEIYLPDFYLPDAHIFCEVKPFQQHDSRWDLLVNETEQSLLLLIGNLSHRPFKALSKDAECYLGIPFKGHKHYPLYFSCGAHDEYLDENKEYANMAKSYRF